MALEGFNPHEKHMRPWLEEEPYWKIIPDHPSLHPGYHQPVGGSMDVTRKLSDSIAIVSGGLDSTTLVYHMRAEGYTPHLLSFNYGQRHKKELQFASYTAKNLGLRHDIVDLTGITHLISNSALTSPFVENTEPWDADLVDHKRDIEVPDGHYAEDSMKATVVPNRNMIMLSIAAGVAVNNKYRTIGFGVHGGDHFIYPDCRPVFVNHVARTIWEANEGFHNFQQGGHGIDEARGGIVYAPFLNKTKADIAYRALELGVPLHLTWSCYKGGERHCGRCGTCVERLEAIDEADTRWRNNFEYNAREPHDLTDYEDEEFWKTAVKK